MLGKPCHLQTSVALHLGSWQHDSRGLFPPVAQAWYGKGAAARALERWEAAVQASHCAETSRLMIPIRQTSNSTVQAWYREGAAAQALERWEAAAQAFFEAFRLDPENTSFSDAFQNAVARGQAAHAAAAGRG